MIWKVLGLLLAFSTAPQQSPEQTPPTSCGLSSLSACRTTNNLVWDTGFGQALGRFLGERQAAYLWERGSVRDQARAVLGGPPDAPIIVENLYRFTACRLHSCPEKGAVFLTSSGEIMAVAILHSTCATAPRPAHCAETMRLAVYLDPDADRTLIVGDLSHWAEDALARLHTFAGLAPPTLEGVDVLTAGSSN
ncbi:hypothetical protein [Brevundimonas intermedia]|uniref:hypothetical protein n=1 Tax=Brevundimonas intermedia TaxID=74315 RepID=UPI0032091D29